MRVTQLKGRPVVDPTTARRCGVVVDVLVDATAARVAAMDVGSPAAEARDRIPAGSIARIGRHAVMLARQRTDRSPPSDECLDCASLVGLEVLDDGGDRVGYLHDARLDPEDLTIRGYELQGAFWRRWLRWRSEVRPDEVTSWSRELLLVKARRRAPGGAAGDQE